MKMPNEEHQTFDSARYPLLHPDTLAMLTKLDRLAPHNPTGLILQLQDILGKISIQVIQGDLGPDAMRQMEQAAAEMLKLHPKPVTEMPSQNLQEKMRHAANAAALKATRHPEYNGHLTHAEELGYIDRGLPGLHGHPHIFRVFALVKFYKNGHTMLVNPRGLERNYDDPQMTTEGADFLRQALVESAQEEGLYLNDRVKACVHHAQEGWVSMGYDRVSQPKN